MYKAGDVIFVKHSSWLSRQIRNLTNSEYNHVGIFVDELNIVESTFNGVTFSPISKFEDGKKSGVVIDYAVYRLKEPMNDDQLSIIKEYVISKIGGKYDFWQLFSLFVVLILNSSKVRKSIDISNAWICSELIAEAFYNIGIDFGKGILVDNVTPADILYSNLLEKVS